MHSLIAVFIGGGLGSLCRYGMSLYLPSADFPFATLGANIVACFILGFWTAHSTRQEASGFPLGALIGTGFCGGFSTFSTFTKEHVSMLSAGSIGGHVVYVTVSYILGMLAFYIGYNLASRYML